MKLINNLFPFGFNLLGFKISLSHSNPNRLYRFVSSSHARRAIVFIIYGLLINWQLLKIGDILFALADGGTILCLQLEKCRVGDEFRE